MIKISEFLRKLSDYLLNEELRMMEERPNATGDVYLAIYGDLTCEVAWSFNDKLISDIEDINELIEFLDKEIE